jgi:hypothetical protein
LLVESNLLSASNKGAAVNDVVHRLLAHFGKRVTPHA